MEFFGDFFFGVFLGEGFFGDIFVFLLELRPEDPEGIGSLTLRSKLKRRAADAVLAVRALTSDVTILSMGDMGKERGLFRSEKSAGSNARLTLGHGPP